MAIPASMAHVSLIATVTDLYTTLHQLAIIPETLLRVPSPETGLHPLENINSNAAKEAGYDEDAIALMYALPYLDVEIHTEEVQLLENSYLTSYLGAEVDADDFHEQRELLDDEMMPPTAVRFTWSYTGYGEVFIYDTKTKLMTPWIPCDNEPGQSTYSHITGASPQDVLEPIIDDYRKLRYLGTPLGILHEVEVDRPPRPDVNERTRYGWARVDEENAAIRKIREIYVECGWDVEARRQLNFRRDEFLAKRQKYWDEVVEPLRRSRTEGWPPPATTTSV